MMVALSPRMGFVLGVLGQQPGVTIALAEGLNGGLVIEQGRDDVTVLGGVLGTHYDPVAIADCSIDHGVALDSQHKEVTLTYELAGERHDVFNCLLSGNG